MYAIVTVCVFHLNARIFNVRQSEMHECERVTEKCVFVARSRLNMMVNFLHYTKTE